MRPICVFYSSLQVVLLTLVNPFISNFLLETSLQPWQGLDDTLLSNEH
jgi:hypothetical protein